MPRNVYPKAGSEEEYWERCRRAAELLADGVSYRTIASELGVSLSMAVKYVRRYLHGAMRFFSAPELRERLALSYERIYSRVAVELARLDEERPNPDPDDPREMVPLLAMSDKERLDAKLSCLLRQQSIIDSQARLFGFVGNDLNINFNVQRPDQEQLPSASQRKKMRALVRMQKKLRDSGDEMTPAAMVKAVEAEFKEIDKKNGGPE